MPVQPLRDEELPPLYHAADMSSLEAQTRFLRFSWIRLLGLIAASGFGLATWTLGNSPTDWAGVLAACCFGSALVVEGFLLKTKPERTWYEGRAAAESVKTLSWRYAVGGEPFNIGSTKTEAEVEDLFLRQLASVLEILKDLELTPPTSSGEQISGRMREVRAASLGDRKAAYDQGRVVDQQAWYRKKAAWNKVRAARWTMGMLVIEVGGVAAGILKAVGILAGDFLGFVGALVASMTAWLQTKQHRTLASAYTVTTLELASVLTKIHHQHTESDWAKFVSDAEEAFSREHTLWKASRGIRSM